MCWHIALVQLEGAVADAAAALGGLGGLVPEHAEVVVDAAHAGLAGSLDALDHPVRTRQGFCESGVGVSQRGAG